MDAQRWWMYLGVIVVVIVSPGPAALQCAALGARHGVARTLPAVLGGTTSAALLMSAAAFGVLPLLQASATSQALLRLAAIAMLAWFGVSAWRSGGAGVAVTRTEAGSPWRRWCAGLAVGLSNPQDVLFFGALLPAFVDPALPVGRQLGCLFATWAVVDGLAMAGYAALGRGVGPRRARWLQRCSGTVLLGSALALAFDTWP